MAVSCSSTLLLTPKSHIIYVQTKDHTGHWIHSVQAEHVCCQLLSLSASLPLEAALARKGIFSAWSSLKLFCTWCRKELEIHQIHMHMTATGCANGT